MVSKPISGRAYGTISHLPDSFVSRGDKYIKEPEANILTVKSRKDDVIVVQEKLDGTCVAVCKINGELVPIQRKGYPCWSSPHSMHGMFAVWVEQNKEKLQAILRDGERLVGEWIVQAHGTRYELHGRAEPFVPFDLFDANNRRLTCANMHYRLYDDRKGYLLRPVRLVHIGAACSVELAKEFAYGGWSNPDRIWPVAGESSEGFVWRCERGDRVLFLAKWVRPDFVVGKYLPHISGDKEVWNCDASKYLPDKNGKQSV